MTQATEEIGCKWSKAVYVWPRVINRKWGNNHIVVKLPPIAMAALQAKDDTLLSQEAILRDYFQLKGVEWDDNYLWLNAEAPDAVEAKADTSGVEIDPATLEKVKASLGKLGEDKVRLLLAAAHFSQKHIDAYVTRATTQDNPFL